MVRVWCDGREACFGREMRVVIRAGDGEEGQDEGDEEEEEEEMLVVAMVVANELHNAPKLSPRGRARLIRARRSRAQISLWGSRKHGPQMLSPTCLLPFFFFFWIPARKHSASISGFFFVRFPGAQHVLAISFFFLGKERMSTRGKRENDNMTHCERLLRGRV